MPWSPCFHFLEMHWLYYMRKIGFDIRLQLEAACFYPQGGGHLHGLGTTDLTTLPVAHYQARVTEDNPGHLANWVRRIIGVRSQIVSLYFRGMSTSNAERKILFSTSASPLYSGFMIHCDGHHCRI